MAKLDRRQILKTDAIIVKKKEKKKNKEKECWTKTAKLDTQLCNGPQTNKTIIFVVIFSAGHKFFPILIDKIHLYSISFLNAITLLYHQFSSVAQMRPTLCDSMNCSMPGLPVHHQLPEFTQTHVHRVGDAIQPSDPLSSPSSPVPNPSQHQGLFQ